MLHTTRTWNMHTHDDMPQMWHMWHSLSLRSKTSLLHVPQAKLPLNIVSLISFFWCFKIHTLSRSMNKPQDTLSNRIFQFILDQFWPHKNQWNTVYYCNQDCVFPNQCWMSRDPYGMAHIIRYTSSNKWVKIKFSRRCRRYWTEPFLNDISDDPFILSLFPAYHS